MTYLYPSSFAKKDLLTVTIGKLFKHNIHARLPKPPLLMVDRILHISKKGGKFNKGEVIAELDIKPDMWFFDCHFDRDPVMPGCLGLDALWQLIGFFLSWTGLNGKGRALGVGRVKFSGQILPEKTCITYHLHFRRFMLSKKISLGIAYGTVSHKGEIVYEAEDLRTGLIPA